MIAVNPMTAADIGQLSEAGDRVQIYADGCYEPQSQTGGWAFVAYRDGLEVASEFGGRERSSNNAMELMALLQAVQWLNANGVGERSILWSDSAYAVNGCNHWRHIWKSRNWRKQGPNPKARSRSIANPELWIAIDHALSKNQRVDVAWCKGHSGISGNERADSLAEFGRSLSVAKRGGR